MATTAIQWNRQISKELDSDLSGFLATDKGSATEADIAAFVEDAARDRIF